MKDSIDIYGMIDSVFIFGACVSISKDQWEQIGPIPSSRFVNCFSEKDWFLKILFRLKLSPAAGSASIDVKEIENINVSSLIESHGDYVNKFEELMTAVGIEKK